MTGEDQLISVRDAARECGRNAETVRRWIWSGKLPAEKLGNQLFIRRSTLAGFCREMAITFQAEAKDNISEQHVKPDDNTNDSSGSMTTQPGSRLEILEKMRTLREEIRAHTGNINIDEAIEELREERTNGITGMY